MAGNYSYNKKSYFTPKNILIYLIVGGLIYGLVYYFYMKRNGTSPYMYTAPSAGGVGSTPSENSTMTVALATQNDSGQTGTATLSEENGKTKVVLTVENEPAGSSEPAHIHVGACPSPGAVKYPLSNVVDGTSETIVDVDMATLKSQLPLAINVHKSSEEIKTYVACGDIK